MGSKAGKLRCFHRTLLAEVHFCSECIEFPATKQYWCKRSGTPFRGESSRRRNKLRVKAV